VTRDWARPVVHWAIEALDPERQRRFYAELFSWDIEDGPFMPIAAGFGGPEPGPGGHIQQGERPAVSLYVQVRDLRESLDRAVELGGAIVAEPFQFPGQPTLAQITDPEGNTVMLVQQ
jgi:predicted enzyme related to lactoylglutathione lyase